MKITSNELRTRYINFFVSRGHVQIPSASLVPENDPSVLFTTAGMHPLVPYLMGEPHPSGTRLVDVQKCVRTGDIDEVGDNTHLTFFEMLGNWSLGDYFKQDAIKWSFEFLTQELGIPVDRLAVSVFAGDDDAPFDQESYDRWVQLGIVSDRIAKLGKEDNWWPAGGKHPGPQGPDTEMFYWTGSDAVPETFDPADKQWVEIWNDVFMQFNRAPDGRFEPLARQNVDTGMGLERTLAVLNGKESVYDTDLFMPIIQAIERESARSYSEHVRQMRIVTDHIRSSVMMIADGVASSNKDQGYVLRRLIRRSVRELRAVNEKHWSFHGIVDAVIATLAETYPTLTEKRQCIADAIDGEVAKFAKTMDQGLRELEKLVRIGQIVHIPDGGQWPIYNRVDAKKAFDIYQTYGFPLEMIQEELAKRALLVDESEFRKAFDEHMRSHQNLSRVGSQQKFAGGLADHSEESKKLHTATHLLHKALRMVLGDHVAQKGSNITAERLRFDFSHDKKMTPDEVRRVEEIVNEQIKAGLLMGFTMMTVEEAKAAGAIGLFEDTYAQIGGKVKVYTAGDDAKGVFSREICGGPHVDNTSTLEAFAIQKEEASSSGVRRIKAVIGPAAVALLATRKT
ncbi:MAG: alanine--tRNA ligase [Patescibacteria group bacterium]